MLGLAPVPHLDDHLLALVSPGDRHGVIGAGFLVSEDGVGAGLGHGDLQVVDLLLIEARGPRQGRQCEPDDSDVGGAGRDLYLDLFGRAQAFAPEVASSTEAWIGKTLVSPVILKIFRILSCVQTSDRSPS